MGGSHSNALSNLSSISLSSNGSNFDESYASSPQKTSSTSLSSHDQDAQFIMSPSRRMSALPSVRPEQSFTHERINSAPLISINGIQGKHETTSDDV